MKWLIQESQFNYDYGHVDQKLIHDPSRFRLLTVYIGEVGGRAIKKLIYMVNRLRLV